MKTHSIFRTLATLTCVATMAISTAGDDRASLEKTYTRLCKGLKSMDRGVYAMLAPGFTWVSSDGHSMSRSEFIAMNDGQLKAPGLKFHEVTMKNDSFDFMGKEARVRSSMVMVMSMLEGKKRVKYRMTSESVDTWRKGPKGWLCHKVEETHSTFGPAE